MLHTINQIQSHGGVEPLQGSAQLIGRKVFIFGADEIEFLSWCIGHGFDIV